MRNGPWEQHTLLQTFDPAGGSRMVTVADLPGVSLPLDTYMHLTINGERWYPTAPRSVAIDTEKRTVVTTLTVIKD